MNLIPLFSLVFIILIILDLPSSGAKIVPPSHVLSDRPKDLNSKKIKTLPKQTIPKQSK